MSAQTAEAESNQNRRRWGIILILLPILGCLALVVLFLLQTLTGTKGPEFLPIQLHSQLEANYLTNPNPTRIPGVRFDIIWDALRDREPGATDIEGRQAALLNTLLTPVPTVQPALLACQDIQFIYPSQDTWIDSINPESIYGSDTLLQLGREGEQVKRLLLYFAPDTLPQNTLFHSVYLEMDVAQTFGAIPADPLIFSNLQNSFNESEANWINRPQSNIQYKKITQINASNIHVWDVTDIVRDWISNRHRNNGLMIESQLPANFAVVYHSREISPQTPPTSNPTTTPQGPRLVINCEGALPQAEAVAVGISTITPTPNQQPTTSFIPGNATASATLNPPINIPSPTSPPIPSTTATPNTLPSPSPTTASVPSPTSAILPSPTASVPVPTPTSSPIPAPTPNSGGGGGSSPTDTPIPPTTADLTFTKSDTPDPVIAGHLLTYTLNVTNNGPSNATVVTITDTLPANTAFNAALSDATCNLIVSAVICNVAPLLNGNSAQRTIVVTVATIASGNLFNTATVAGNEVDTTPGNNTNSTNTTVNTQADLIITKSAAPNPVIAGQQLTYTLIFTNNGPSVAQTIIITDTLPGGAIFVSATGGCTNNSGAVTCAVASLGVGNTLQRNIVVTVNPSVTNSLTNSVIITGATTDPTPGNNANTTNTVVNTQADLTITKHHSANPILSGQTLTYTLFITNNGPSDAQGFIVTDTIPPSVTVISVNPVTTTQSGQDLGWNFGLLTSGVRQVITIIGVVNSNFVGILNNTVQVTNTTDAIPSNNSSVITTTVIVTGTDLSISKSGNPNPVTSGQTLTYTLLIVNNNPAAAQNVVITDTLPLSVTILSITPTTTTQIGQTLSWNLSTLPNVANQQITVAVTVDNTFSGVLTNSAVVTSTLIDPIPNNNSAVITTTSQAANLTITKSDTPDPVVAGRPLTYTLNITNNGPSIAQNATITDTLPASVTFVSASVGCANIGGIVTCTVTSLGVGSSLQQTIIVTVNASASSLLTNTVIVNSSTPDPTLNNNADTITTAVQSQADLEISKSDSSDPISAGQTLSYTLVITNNGPSTAQSVVVTDTLPTGVTVTDVNPITNTQSGQNVGWIFANLTGGATQTIIISVSVNSGFSGILTNTAIVTGNTPDPSLGNNTATVTTTVNAQTNTETLWLTTDGDVNSPSGAPGLDSWKAGSVLKFGDPNLTFDPAGTPPNTTDGTFSSLLNLDNLTQNGNANTRALHYVNRDITVGGNTSPSIDLFFGDLLLATQNGEVLSSTNILTVTSRDVFIFRPNTPGDYSSGTFIMLLDDPVGGNIHAISLVEKDTVVGDTTLSAGTFLISHSPAGVHNKIQTFSADDVGTGTTSGTLSILIDGDDIGFTNAQVQGLELVEENKTVGDASLNTGNILVTLNGERTVGSNSVSVTRQDIFYLNVITTSISGTAQATATLFLDGSDMNLDTNQENLNGLALVSTTAASVTTNLFINNITVTEGDSGTITATFSISLSTSSGLTVIVDYATSDYTAIAGSDYITATGTLTFSPDTTLQTFTVQIQGDTLDEANETYTVTLSNPGNAVIVDGSGVGTIIDNDNPTLSINNVSITEGDSGTVSTIFTVTLSAAGVQTATVDYTTANGTAIASSDYTATNSTLTFSPGVTQQNISVQVIGDIITESVETFFVNLSNPTNVTISDGQGVGTIIDDDGDVAPCSPPVTALTATADSFIRANNPANNSGSADTLQVRPDGISTTFRSVLQFDLSSIPPNSAIFCATLVLNQITATNNTQLIHIHQVITNWTELNVTWNNRITGTLWVTPGSDYNPTATANFVPDTTGQRIININSLAQFWINNPSLNFGLVMRSTTTSDNGTAVFSSREIATATLRPRLIATYLPSVAINDVSVFEGNSGTTTAVFSVTLSSAAAQAVTVDYATADNTATIVGNDYIAATGTLTFSPGTTLLTFTITINGDLNHEADETFFVNLSNPTNAGISDGQGIGTILNDELGGMFIAPGNNQIFLPIILKSS